jgi:hypothetical protein
MSTLHAAALCARCERRRKSIKYKAAKSTLAAAVL